MRSNIASNNDWSRYSYLLKNKIIINFNEIENKVENKVTYKDVCDNDDVMSVIDWIMKFGVSFNCEVLIDIPFTIWCKNNKLDFPNFKIKNKRK